MILAVCDRLIQSCYWQMLSNDFLNLCSLTWPEHTLTNLFSVKSVLKHCACLHTMNWAQHNEVFRRTLDSRDVWWCFEELWICQCSCEACESDSDRYEWSESFWFNYVQMIVFCPGHLVLSDKISSVVLYFYIICLSLGSKWTLQGSHGICAAFSHFHHRLCAYDTHSYIYRDIINTWFLYIR